MISEMSVELELDDRFEESLLSWGRVFRDMSSGSQGFRHVSEPRWTSR